jgi:hypothetical protein
MAESKFPWDQLALPTLIAACKDLGYDIPTGASKEDLVTYLKDVNENGCELYCTCLAILERVVVTPQAAAPSEVDYTLIAQQYFKEMEEEDERLGEEMQKEEEALVQRTTDFWSGNISIDPTLERFDDAPGKVSIVVKAIYGVTVKMKILG